MNSNPVDSKRGFQASRLVIFVLIAVFGCLLDLVTKYAVFARLGMPAPGDRNIYWLWEGFCGLETSVNLGALFGYGQGMSLVFGCVSIVFGVVILVWLFWYGGARDLFLTIALACVMAGILGNLYDRMGLWHTADVGDHFRNGVRDWILFRFGSYDWPNFNIADSFLVCGAGLLMWHAFRIEQPSTSAEIGSESGTATS